MTSKSHSDTPFSVLFYSITGGLIQPISAFVKNRQSGSVYGMVVFLFLFLCFCFCRCCYCCCLSLDGYQAIVACTCLARCLMRLVLVFSFLIFYFILEKVGTSLKVSFLCNLFFSYIESFPETQKLTCETLSHHVLFLAHSISNLMVSLSNLSTVTIHHTLRPYKTVFWNIESWNTNSFSVLRKFKR